MSGRALVRFGAETQSPVALVCFPWAGAGAAAYRDWPALLPGAVSVWAARLPGRESRRAEAPVPDVVRLAEHFADAVAAEAGPDPILFGHCSGALLAYRVLVALRRRGLGRGSALLVAAQPGPSLPARPEPAGFAGTDTATRLRALGFRDAAILGEPELLALLGPAIAADLGMVATYRHAGTERLDVPVTAFAARQDALVARDELAAWAGATTAGFRLVDLDGDHLFGGASRAGLAAALGAEACRLGRCAEAVA